ncbi:MAG: DUF11 domain-containing protein, partial [Planctomycetes bacterium]|nr:DUF11 domain-containing protein [Planctomycetota bacterium]
MSLRSALVVLFVVGVLVGCRSEQVSNQPIAPAATWAPYGPQQYYASPMGMPPSSPPGANPPACCPLPTPAPMVIQPMALNCMTTWVQDGKIHVTSLFPTGDPATSQVYVELIGPTEVAINQPFDYQIIVKNLSPCTLIDVIVCDTISAIAEFIKSTPRESKCAALADGLENCRQSRRICWDLGTLAPQEAKTIDVTAVVRAAGDVAHCITVDWKRNICIPLAVIESKLQLTKTAPAEVMACEPIPMKLTVTNTGSSLAKGVKIKDTLPSGLATQDGKTTVDFDAGDLIQGQSREFTIMAQASRPGRYTNTAIATAERGATSEATSTTVVRAPVLEITKSASRSTVFAGQPVVYELTVANKGDGAAKDTVLKDMIPAGTSF